MSAILIETVVGNWLPLVIAAVAAFITGKAYLKGRKHAKGKADKELDDALARVRDDAKAAIAAGNRIDTRELYDDDGFRRD